MTDKLKVIILHLLVLVYTDNWIKFPQRCFRFKTNFFFWLLEEQSLSRGCVSIKNRAKEWSCLYLGRNVTPQVQSE